MAPVNHSRAKNKKTTTALVQIICLVPMVTMTPLDSDLKLE